MYAYLMQVGLYSRWWEDNERYGPDIGFVKSIANMGQMSELRPMPSWDLQKVDVSKCR